MIFPRFALLKLSNCANFVKIKSCQLTSRKTTKKQGLSRKLKAKSKIIFNS